MYSHHLTRALASARAPGPRLPPHLSGVRLRPIAPTDKAALAAFYAALSPESRHRRFLTPRPALSERELAYFTEIDHRRHEALVAYDGSGRFLGVGHYAVWARDRRAGDIAVAVADDHQRGGLGTGLTSHLIRRARANRLHRLTATTQAHNVACQRMLRKLGFRLVGHDGGLTELELAL